MLKTMPSHCARIDWSQAQRRLFGYLALAVLVTMVLLPMLSSGYYSDDLLQSTTKGQVGLQNISIVQFVIDDIRTWMTHFGRVFPVHAFFTLPVLYFLTNLVAYKTFIILMVIVNIILFARFIELISGDYYVSILVSAFLPAFLQFRLYHDAMLSFSGQMQYFMSFVIISLMFYIRYLKNNHSSDIVISLIFYNLTLYLYEISLPLVILFIIAMAVFGGDQRVSYKLRTVLPYFVSVMAALSVMVVVKMMRNTAIKGYQGTQLNFDLLPVIKTLCMQIFSTIPLSFYCINPNRVFVHSFSSLLGNFHLVDILTVALFVACYLYASKRIIHRGSFRVWMLFGVALIILPASLVSISLKYQDELYWGNGYIPVYLQYFGAAILVAGSILAVLPMLKRDASRKAFHAAVIFATSVVFLINIQDNRLVIEKSNIDWHYRRSALVRALGENILQSVPENACILIADLYAYDPSPAPLRGGATSYPWMNDALIYQHTNKRVVVMNKLDDLRKYITGDPAGGGCNNVYLITVNSYPKRYSTKEGFVQLSKMERIYLDTAGNLHYRAKPIITNLPQNL